MTFETFFRPVFTEKTVTILTASASLHDVTIDDDTYETYLQKKVYALPKNVRKPAAFLNNLQAYVTAFIVNDFQMQAAALADADEITEKIQQDIDILAEAEEELTKSTATFKKPADVDDFAAFLAFCIVRPRHFSGYGDEIVDTWTAVSDALDHGATDAVKKTCRENACKVFSEILHADVDNEIYGNVKCVMSATAFNDHVVSFFHGAALKYGRHGITAKKITPVDVFRQCGLAILKYSFKWEDGKKVYARGKSILK